MHLSCPQLFPGAAVPAWRCLQVKMWESITFAMASLGSAAQAAIEEDVEELQTAATIGSAAADGSSSSAAAAAADAGEEAAAAEDEDLVEYEGMLVSAAAAQRRRCVRPSLLLGWGCPCSSSSEPPAVSQVAEQHWWQGPSSCWSRNACRACWASCALPAGSSPA